MADPWWVPGLLNDPEEERRRAAASGLLSEGQGTRLYSPNPNAPTVYGAAPEPQQRSLTQAMAQPAPPPLNALWSALPPTARSSYRSLVEALAELSPGAAVRDSVDAYRGMVQNAVAGNTWDALGGGANLLTAMAGVVPGSAVAKRGAKTVADSFQNLDHIKTVINEAGEPAFVRWSRGPKYDLKPGARSMNQTTGQSEAGLSAQLLEPDFDPWVLARRIGEYEFLRFNGKDISPHLYAGKVLGRGGDNEPVIAPTKYLGNLAPELLDAVLDPNRVERLAAMRRLRNQEAKFTNPEWLQNPDVTRYNGLGYKRAEKELEEYRAELERLGGHLVNDPLINPYRR